MYFAAPRLTSREISSAHLIEFRMSPTIFAEEGFIPPYHESCPRSCSLSRSGINEVIRYYDPYFEEDG
jgi:hypothetical protein